MEAKQQPAVAATSRADLERPRLSIKEKVGYSLGDAASNLYFQTFVVFLPIFYTDVFGISASAMGTMLLVTRIFDAVNDPIMGMIADRTNTRWGKFRPYMLWVAVPFAVAGVLAFTTPNFSPTGMLVYAYITYMLLIVAYTAMNVPYAALMGVITPNSAERTEVSSYRFVAAFVGQYIIGVTALGLVGYLGGGNEQLGWQLTFVVYGLLAIVLLFLTFFLTRERVQPSTTQQGTVGEDMKDLFRNVPWMLIGAATIFQLTYIVMRGSATPYYFRYFVEAQEFSFLGMSFDMGYAGLTSSFLAVGTTATIVGAVCTKLFTKFADKKFVYGGFLISSATLSGFFFFVGPSDIMVMFVLNALVSFFFGSVSVLQWTIYTDAADYGEWKFHRRATGLIMAASLFALKLGLTLGGAIVGWILAGYGFVEGGVAQSETTLSGIRLLMSLFPAIFGITGGLIMLFYPLKDKMMVTIEEDLAARHAAG